MLQSSLTFQNEHDAWRQRVTKEAGNTEKFFQTLEMANNGFGSTGFSNNTSATNTIHAYHRSNLDRKLLNREKFHMIDSSYLVASDPNTMRNLGPCRNAEYYFRPPTEEGSMGTFSNTGMSFISYQNPQKSREQFVKNKGNTKIQSIIDHKNRDVYSFGGKTRIGQRYHHKNVEEALHEYDPMFSKTGNKWTQSVDNTQKIIYRNYNHRVNDYSKNVSDNIFSPGQVLMPNYSKKRTQTAGKTRRLGNHRRSINIPQNMKTFNPGRLNAVQLNKNTAPAKKSVRPRSNKTYRSAHSLTRKLNIEKR